MFDSITSSLKPRKAKAEDQPLALPNASTTFSDLPLELRLRIWELALPEPRILKIIAKRSPETSKLKKVTSYGKKTARPENKYTITSASYGGTSHPGILSINQESRNFALQHLTRIFGVYWNLNQDVLYFEIHDIRDEEGMLMTELFEKELLGRFKHIAMDSNLWNWKNKTATMEFECMYGRLFVGWKEPRLILNELCNLETCVVTYTDHTLQKDVIVPGRPWRLGPLNAEVSLDPSWQANTSYTQATIDSRNYNPYHQSIAVRSDLRFSLEGIEGREREYFPPEKPLRPPPLPPNFYDWFG